MKVGTPKIKVVVRKLQIQDLAKFGKDYKGFFYQYSIGLKFNIMLPEALKILM
jgi:hypothetical protein